MRTLQRTLSILLLFLVVAGGVVWFADPFAGLSSKGESSEAVEHTVSESVGGPSGDRSEGTPRRELVEEVRAGGKVEEVEQVVFTGRCVRAEDIDESIAGVRVSLRLHHRYVDRDGVKPSDYDALDLEWTAKSGPDGKFVVGFPERFLDDSLVVTAAVPYCTDSVPLRFDPKAARETRTVSLGDVAIRRGFAVSGTVVDHRGQPIARDVLRFPAPFVFLRDGRLVSDDDPRWIVRNVSRHRSVFAVVRDGRFDFGSVFAGKFTPELGSGSVVEPRAVVVGPEHDTTNLRIVVHEGLAVEGVVLDATGKPVPKFGVGFEEGSGHHSGAATDERGRFRAHVSSVEERFVRFLPTSTGDGSGPCFPGTGWIELPATGLELRVSAWPEFLVRVQQPDGAYATNVAVRADQGYGPAEVGDPVDGVSRWRGLQPGKQKIFVIGYKPTFTYSPPIEFDPADHTTTPLEVKTLPTARLTVHVGLEDIWVSVIGPNGRFWGGRTGADGIARLDVPVDFVGCTLTVRSGSSSSEFDEAKTTLTLTKAHEKSGEVRVTLPPARPATKWSAELAIRLGGPAAKASSAIEKLLRIRSADGKHDLEIDLDGLRRLQPGKWQIVLLDPGTQTHRVLRELTVDADEMRDVTLALPDIVPAEVGGVARHRGRLLRHCGLRFAAVDGTWGETVEVGGDGRFGPVHLPQGACRVSVPGFRVPGVAKNRVLWFPAITKLAPGGTHDLKLDTGTLTQKLRVLEADGTPARRGWFEIPQWGALRSDEEGEVSLYALPPSVTGVVLQTRPAPGQPVRKVLLRPGVKIVRLPAR